MSYDWFHQHSNKRIVPRLSFSFRFAVAMKLTIPSVRCTAFGGGRPRTCCCARRSIRWAYPFSRGRFEPTEPTGRRASRPAKPNQLARCTFFLLPALATIAHWPPAVAGWFDYTIWAARCVQKMTNGQVCPRARVCVCVSIQLNVIYF